MQMMMMMQGRRRFLAGFSLVGTAALRLHEAGIVKSSPQTIIANGTDWRFLR